MHPIIAIAQGITADPHTARWTHIEYVEEILGNIAPAEAADEVARSITADPEVARRCAAAMDEFAPRK